MNVRHLSCNSRELLPAILHDALFELWRQIAVRIGRNRHDVGDGQLAARLLRQKNRALERGMCVRGGIDVHEDVPERFHIRLQRLSCL